MARWDSTHYCQSAVVNAFQISGIQVQRFEFVVADIHIGHQRPSAETHWVFEYKTLHTQSN